jgi:hypothetical protein
MRLVMQNRMKTAVTLACFFGAVVLMNQHARAKDNVRYPNVVLPDATIEPVSVRAEI